MTTTVMFVCFFIVKQVNRMKVDEEAVVSGPSETALLSELRQGDQGDQRLITLRNDSVPECQCGGTSAAGPAWRDQCGGEGAELCVSLA